MITTVKKPPIEYKTSSNKSSDVIKSELYHPNDSGKEMNPKSDLVIEKLENEIFINTHVVLRPFKCYLCGLVFDRISQFDNHIRSVHHQERSQVCQICGKGFFRQNDLKTHLNIHLGTNRCMCEICGRKFNHVSNLIRHSRTHSGVKPYPCSICGKRFAQINTLARHKAIHKRGDEIMECCFCDKKYKSDNGLKEHMKKLHGLTERSNPEDLGRIVKRKHYCKICGESFQFVELLRVHEETHKNVEILECKSCGRKFQKTDEIKEHRCGRQKLVIPNAISAKKIPNVKKNRSNLLSKENAKSVLIQLSGIDEDSKEPNSSCNEINTSTDNSRIIGIKNYINNELDKTLSQAGLISSNKTADDKQTKETIVYVTTEQLASMNMEQVVDTANHFLHQHLMELAAENSLQPENISSKDCDEETVVSEMIKSCWKEIEMPDVNESEICDKRDSPISKNSTQSIIYIHALEKDGLIFLNEYGNLVSNITPNLTPGKSVVIKSDSNSIKNLSLNNELGNSQTEKICQNEYDRRNSLDLIQNVTTSKRLSSNPMLHENKTKNIREQNHKQDKNTSLTIKAMKGLKGQNTRNYFSEENANKDDNLPVETTNTSLTNNMFEELLENNSDNVINAVIGKSSDNQEPALRLVQTENGQQFYELLITSNSTERSESSFELDKISTSNENFRITENKTVPGSLIKVVQLENGERVLELTKNTSVDRIEEHKQAEDIKFGEKSALENLDHEEMRVKNKCEKIFYLAQTHKDNMIDFFEIETLGEQEQSSFNLASDEVMDNVSQTSFNNLEILNRNKSLENDELPIDNENCEELLGLIQNSPQKHNEKSKIECRKTKREEDGPMVRLVQNEDGAQFFELIRGDLEFDETQDFELLETNETNQTHNPQFSNDVKGSKKLHLDTGCTINDNTKSESVITRKKKHKINAKKYNCDVCKKSFSKGYNYRQHIGTHFADQQKFKCKECGTFFAWKSTLNKHMAIHRAGGQQKFVCEICPKVYTTLSQVNEHVKRDHLKERNHKCVQCGKTFFKKFDLKIHIRTHTKERPYECRVCYKSFHHQSHIIRHERIHSGERPYACNICEKAFTQLGSLKNHRQRHQELKIDILDYQMDEDDPLPRTNF